MLPRICLLVVVALALVVAKTNNLADKRRARTECATPTCTPTGMNAIFSA